MSNVKRRMFIISFCSILAAAPPLWAYWVTDGAAICVAAQNQQFPEMISDGAGGAIFAWHDYRSANGDIYIQRVSSSGAPLWTANGVPLCTASGHQTFPNIVSDGAGGAVVAWVDMRSGTNDIYAQRVNASGIPQWTSNGVAVCTATGSQEFAAIASDGAGGAIIAWSDYRLGNWDIYAQRVNASGVAQWTYDGVVLCSASSSQAYPMVASDGSGGAVVGWEDNRSGASDIYAQRVNASGAALWTSNGVAVCTATGTQNYAVIASDGAGGAIAAWTDYRGGGADIYAQRMNASGTAQWTSNGLAVCTAAGTQMRPAIDADGAGGAVVAWEDFRSGNIDTYAQRVNALGFVQWATQGVAVCTAASTQHYPAIISDGVGGAVVAWSDSRGGNYDIYAQRVNASGAVQWTANGVVLCSVVGDQGYPCIVPDGMGGAIVGWSDGRCGDSDVYGQSVDISGRVGVLAPEIRSVRDVPGDQGGKVYLSWRAARADLFMESAMSHYSVWRAISAAYAAAAIDDGASVIESLSGLDAAGGKKVLRIDQAGGLAYYWELVETIDAAFMETYGKPVATLFDSTAACTEHHYFQVVAHTIDPRVFWKSAPDSGRSVDNLAPCAPLRLAGEQSHAPAGLNLTWRRNTESDLGGYRVYRGFKENFTPSEEYLIASPCDTAYFDGKWRWSEGYYYMVSAVDVHGNESGFALLRPDDVTGGETPRSPEASYLAQNYPNPFNPLTRVEYGLAAPARVRLRIYDAAGRLVRSLVEAERPAGRHVELWDGRDASGRLAASGIYFYRLDAGSFSQTRKTVLAR
ncbi:MAG: T9SS C-terminal target domain-containing protein [Candidatus Latescibacterota bacterium]|nr:MAG: T9SS C-terminal target domain-containing protein [Candidatus Latescibacterota bacterium]